MLRAVIFLATAYMVHCCTTDADCSLNGVCSSGQCDCDPAWGGADCGVLQLLPTPKANGMHVKSSTWGGSIHKDPVSGKWYMFASEFINNCGLQNWSPNSRVIRTVSTTDSPLGPYTFDTVILPTFHHNPMVRRTSNGSYVMFVIGRDCNQTVNCNHGPQPSSSSSPCPVPGDTAPGNMESGISAYFAQSLTSQWASLGEVLGSNVKSNWDADTTNPGPYVHANGSVLLMYRGCGDDCTGGEQIGLATAPTFTSSVYTRLNKAQSLCKTCLNEDPFVYQDKRGNYHSLMHNLGNNGGFACYEINGAYHGCDVGTHAFSPDGISWTFSKTIPYNTTVNWDDGTSVVLNRRERPQLVVENGVPLYLSNGIEFHNDGGSSHTLVVPIKH
eukprot:TRINITY_DN15134_c0_g1_i1.p1 TRINITY_DN15134_c0_g1~~TRINITY_DN15134_c0_g1_i1.p1  ORF type:complete len:386 (+),score=80.96 TRINITY_DN15134_c0_g1_i1:34-1191(+)